MSAARLTVTSPASGPFSDPLLVLASLPMTLHPVSADADLVGIRGAVDWPRIASDSIKSGARGVLVIDPKPAKREALQSLAATGVPVVLDSPWVHNAAVAAAAAPFRRLTGAKALVESTVILPVGSDLLQAAIDQLSLLRAAVGALVSLRYVRLDSHGYDALGSLADGTFVTLSAILSNGLPPRASVRLVRPAEAVELSLDGPQTATPGRVVVSGPDGEVLQETRYESAHRVAWKRLVGLIAKRSESDSDSQPDVAGFAEDLDLLSGAAPDGAV